MADIIDQADDFAEREKALAVEAIRKAAAGRELNPRGSCHWCEEPFPVGDRRLFCDSGCADDHAAAKRLRG